MNTPNLPSADNEVMRRIADSVKCRLPAGYGFFVLVMPFDSTDGRANYVSNITRETALLAMKEFLLRAGAAEDWMQHIK
jgi:hypothetical protein